VLEDDLETSPHFLTYMNDALDRYADQPRVAAISGYHSLTDRTLPETFFQRDAECWGWGTWQRAWSGFNPDGAALLAQLKKQKLLRFFDQDGTYPYTDMLRGQIAGTNDSWAIRWRAHVILNDLLSLYPGRSLVRNTGLDGSGTHSRPSDFFAATLSATPVRVEDIALEHSQEADAGFKQFNRRNFGGGLRRLVRRIWAWRQGEEAAGDFCDIEFVFRIGAAARSHFLAQCRIVQQTVQPRDKALFVARFHHQACARVPDGARRQIIGRDRGHQRAAGTKAAEDFRRHRKQPGIRLDDGGEDIRRWQDLRQLFIGLPRQHLEIGYAARQGFLA
jgi:hypothetical protein